MGGARHDRELRLGQAFVERERVVKADPGVDTDQYERRRGDDSDLPRDFFRTRPVEWRGVG